MDTANESYKKWRNLLFRANVIIACLVFLSEIIIYFFLRAESLIFQPLSVYFFRYLILPTILDILILLIGKLFLQHLPAKARITNYVPVVQMTLICLVVAATHNIFSVTMCVFCFPIFSTTLFNNKKMTSRITLLSVLCVLITIFIRAYFRTPGSDDTYLIEESLIAIAITVGTNILSNVLNNHQNMQRNIIETSFQKQMQMLDLLNHDQLTSLYSHTAFMNHLHEVLDIEDAYDDLLYVMAIIKIDDFKSLNNKYGHSKGDFILRRVATLIQNYCDKNAFAARLSGTKFVILFSGSTLHQCNRILNDLKNDFETQPFDFTDKPVTLSCGLSSFMPGESADAFYTRTRDVLAKAKGCSKNQTVLARP